MMSLSEDEISASKSVKTAGEPSIHFGSIYEEILNFQNVTPLFSSIILQTPLMISALNLDEGAANYSWISFV